MKVYLFAQIFDIANYKFLNLECFAFLVGKWHGRISR
jgi:hypothetical protein